MQRRWGISDGEQLAAKRLLEFPQTLDDWVTTSEAELDETSLKILQPSASLLRTVQREGNEVPVIMTLLVGPPGNIGAHTPEVCVSGSGYEKLGDTNKGDHYVKRGPGSNGRIPMATFRSRESTVTFCGSIGAGAQERPGRPRKTRDWAMDCFPYLYKAQFACRLPAGFDSPVHDPTLDWLSHFVAESSQYLVSPATQ